MQEDTQTFDTAATAEPSLAENKLQQMLAQWVEHRQTADATAYARLLDRLSATLPAAGQHDGQDAPDTPPMAFEVDGVVIAVCHEPELHTVGLYADMGQPAAEEGWAMAQALRRLLELNHAGTHGAIRFGLHPVSGRAIAHCHPDLALLATDDACCHETLQRLASVARSESAW